MQVVFVCITCSSAYEHHMHLLLRNPAVTCVQAEGGEWKQDLLFVVPRAHEEVVRLENRYKKYVAGNDGMFI